MKEGLTPSKIDQLLAKLKPHPVVALVDDDTTTSDLLERALKDEGYLVHRFERAEDLLGKCPEIRPDAIVMEAVLEGMNGLSALEELRPKSPETSIPIVIVSKKTDLRAKLLAFRRGAVDYIEKPFEAEEVTARIRGWVRQRLVQEMLQLSSLADPLTSLYNRRFLESWLGLEIERAKRYGLGLSCLMVGLDGFRRINEENGEAFGDCLLGKFARVLAKNIRASDISGRLGNDQFLVFLPAASKEQAMVAARRLRRVVSEEKFQIERKTVELSFSIGIAGGQASQISDSNTFLLRAQEALSKAKAVGTGETAVLGID